MDGVSKGHDNEQRGREMRRERKMRRKGCGRLCRGREGGGWEEEEGGGGVGAGAVPRCASLESDGTGNCQEGWDGTKDSAARGARPVRM